MSQVANPSEARRALILAIVTICAGVGFLVMNDALAKLLSDRYQTSQIIFIRNLIALPVITALILVFRGPGALWSARVGIHALRGLILVVAAYLYFTSLRSLPLAEATVIVFSAPLFITALSVPLLGEAVGWRRWSAVLLGFVGVLIIVQPGGAAFQPAAMMALGTAVLYALFMIGARWVPPGDGIWTMMFFVMLFPLIFIAPLAAYDWVAIAASDAGLFIAIALCGSFGVTLIGQAFRMAPVAVVAPFDYTALIWAMVLGWLIWGEVPGGATLLGAAVIVASGIMIILREARLR